VTLAYFSNNGAPQARAVKWIAAVALTVIAAGDAIAQEAVHRHQHHHRQHRLQPGPSPDFQPGPSFEAPNSSIYWSPAGGNPVHYAQTTGFYGGSLKTRSAGRPLGVCERISPSGVARQDQAIPRCRLDPRKSQTISCHERGFVLVLFRVLLRRSLQLSRSVEVISSCVMRLPIDRDRCRTRKEGEAKRPAVNLCSRCISARTARRGTTERQRARPPANGAAKA
jgi:hypothetical protein